jgi:polysaccharide chain length determinant protein (PEP-CTERM system associated)
MLGHRALTSEDYFAILKRRRWVIVGPILLFPILALALTFLLQPKYLSQTLVLVESPKVPDEYVKPVVSSDIDSRLSAMKEQILSRSRIQPIIERYNLYSSQRLNMDDRIDLARKAISIQPIHSQITHPGGLPGFFISFTASDAHTAQLVCGDITSLFLNENLRSREASAEGTTDFLRGQLGDAKRNLDQQDAKLAAFQRQYVGKLPGEASPNLNMLTSLNTQLEAATQALARMEQDKTYEESLLAQQTGTMQMGSGSIADTRPAPTAIGQVRQVELQQLLSQEADLTSHYTDDYPDVISVRSRIALLRKQIAAASVVSAAGATPETAATPRPAESLGVQQLRAQLRAASIGIQAKRKEQAQIQGAVRLYQDRIESSPLVEEQYKALTRDYQTALKFYDDLLAKMNESKMATDLEHRQQGEQFTVMDAPNLPDAPTFPQRWLFALGGLALGVLTGILIAAWLEYRDTSLRSERDIWAFTGLPTLAVISYSDETGTPIRSPRPPRSRWSALSKHSKQMPEGIRAEDV